MDGSRAQPPERGEDAGRTDDSATLRRRLVAAGEAYLLGAAENPQLGDPELSLLLRNRRCPAKLLARFSTERASSQEIKRLLVLHPRTPLTQARTLLPHLFWRDLSAVTIAAHTNPVLRHQAERLLSLRLEELALGERVALARRAPRGLIAALRETGEPRVLDTLLDNPRTIEADAVTLARDETTPPETLTRLAGHRGWGKRREVRLALVHNPTTPVAAALRAARGMETPDLRPLSNDATVRRIVRVAATRELVGRSGTV